MEHKGDIKMTVEREIEHLKGAVHMMEAAIVLLLKLKGYGVTISKLRHEITQINDEIHYLIGG